MPRRKHYLRPGKDLLLDWRPLYRELKVFVLPSESGVSGNSPIKRNIRTLTKLCTFAQIYFDPSDIPTMLAELLPFFSASFAETGYVVTALLNLLFPTYAPPEKDSSLLPQEYFPAFFHLWSLVNRSRLFDVHFVDIFSRSARDLLHCQWVPFGAYGIFTEEQSSLIFTAILRLLEIPVGQSGSPYSGSVDMNAGLAVMLERDARKHPISHHIARWIVMSLSPKCLDVEDSILANLENLILGVETFFHPSNSGHWTKTLTQLVYYMADFFVMRWNREHSGEMEVPPDRRLNDQVKKRFVLCLREVVFMGIYSKSGTAMNFSLSTLQCLAYLEPNLILPGALQRIYPAMQGLVEVHRTISSIRALQMLAKTMVRTKGYRCHVTSLLGLALPGIDPNDLEKTVHTLAFIQAVAYNIPFHDLTKEKPSGVPENILVENETGRATPQPAATPAEAIDTSVAIQWITDQVDRLEREGTGIEMNYEEELSDQEEEIILRSSTTGFSEFVISLLGRVFTLLKNLPDASRVRSGSPEENVVNTLPATFNPLLAALSPELYDIALNKIAHFVNNNTIHQARDAVAFICNALVKINPQKALQRLLPDILAGIRDEILENGAGSSRTTGSEVIPRDQALVWHISMLSMCVVHVGDAVLKWETELFDIAHFMQEKCKGIPTVHVSNFIHHLLLNLTLTYTLDFSTYEPSVLKQGLKAADWGKYTEPKNLTVKWHKPKPEEIQFAIRLFDDQAKGAINALLQLIGPNPPVTRDGTGKAWSDEISRSLVLLRLIISGLSVLWDPRYNIKPGTISSGSSDSVPTVISLDSMDIDEDPSIEDDAPTLGEADDEVRPTFQYETGYPLERGSPEYEQLHTLRNNAGVVLHQVHVFLVEHQEDDVQCFNALYNAYRSWFIDVGIERSAHILDRVSRLLKADTAPYKFSGLRKQYPRPLLVRRANVYHLQRLRFSATPRPKTDLEIQLLLDLTQSSVSLYTEIRRTAQSAGESAVKCIIGARPLIIPPLLRSLEDAVREQNFPRIKGAMFSLLFGSLAKTIARDWRYTPRLIKAFIEVTNADKPSIQRLSGNASFQILDMAKALEQMVVLEQDVVENILPDKSQMGGKSIDEQVEKKRLSITKRRAKVEQKKADLSVELTEMTRDAHWKKAQRTAALVVGLGVRFDKIAVPSLIDMVAKGTVDPHPTLRFLYQNAMLTVFALINARCICQHDYRSYLLLDEKWPDKTEVDVNAKNDPEWTEKYLKSFSQADAEHYVDFDYPGWLVWRDKLPAFLTETPKMDYDDVELSVRKQIGRVLDKKWFTEFFDFMKQEPRDTNADRFRMGHALMLNHAFDLMFEEMTEASFEEVKDLVKIIYGDGSDKHQHRATAEILGALLSCAFDQPEANKTMIWEYAFPIVRGIFKDGLTPENSGYWSSFLHLLLQGKDPRRIWPLVDWLASYRLDMASNAAFKESSKITMLYQASLESGWHFQLDGPILEDFMQHLDHPYKGVREAIGLTISQLYRTRYHESYPDVETFMKAQRESSSIGTRPYLPPPAFTETVNEVLKRMEVWRGERQPGQQTPSSYTSGGKTVLLWFEHTLSSYECTQLTSFFPGAFTEQLLHMMDIKEDPELQGLAYHVFKQLPNIPHRAGEDREFIDTLIRIGQTASSWHQRLRTLINIQVIYFRRLFLMTREQQLALYDCVSAMLSDSQLEVRLGAAATLSGMIRCSPVSLRDDKVKELKEHFTGLLRKNPLPRRRGFQERVSTPTPEQNKLTITRHSAVLGLGSLVQAFPYTSPPPSWLPEVLATLALKAAGDPGVVGKGVKQILADFKKTRQDTWHVDVKVRGTQRAVRHLVANIATGIRAGTIRGSRGRAVEELLCISMESHPVQERAVITTFQSLSVSFTLCNPAIVVEAWSELHCRANQIFHWEPCKTVLSSGLVAIIVSD
jgi:proteasome activator subunit 4